MDCRLAISMYGLYGVPVTLAVLCAVTSYFVAIHYSNKAFSVTSMASNGLFFVSNAAKVHNVCQKASKFVQKVLYIKINGPSDGFLPIISKQIFNVYSKATSQCSNLDVRLMLKHSDTAKSISTHSPIAVILYDSELAKEIDRLKQTVATQVPDTKLICLDSLEEDKDVHSTELVKRYDYVAVGGTFDRLHNGHKILLTHAALRATRHLTVGVTDVNMIQSKKLWELIEPVEKRIEAVLDFLTDINPDLEYQVLPIRDIYGPTKDDPRFQLLVLSEETVRGGAKVNEKRKELGMSELDTYVVGLAQDSPRHPEEELKVSSSNQRMRLLGTLLRPPSTSPQPNPNIPDWPYVIGLAGGIASGKSSITEKLKAKGAAIINCDHIAHDLYKPGLPINSTIEQTFGEGVITSAGEVDRQKLGQIVFSDKAKLEKLNEILWPAILEEAKRRIKALGEQGYRVVVMEAAVMVRAKWYTHCHQLWSVIIPPEEAIKRLQQRNGLSETEARQRVESQPTNLEQITPANIVFSPYWSYEYTQAQVDRAWEQLQDYLANRK